MSLPEPYETWMKALVGGPLPAEVRADCDHCVMQPGCSDAPFDFHPEAKCCTYVPRIPNYMVGRVLRDMRPGMAVGRASMVARLAALGDKPERCPLGIELLPDEAERYERVVEHDMFGRDGRTRCVHQAADGGCAIWAHRNAICGTWFCKHDRGVAGQSFWTAVEDLLTEVERGLGFWAARRVRYPDHDPDDNEVVYPLDLKLYDGDFGEWADRVDDFYLACAAEVDHLGWTEAQEVAGPSIEEKVQAVLDAHAALEEMTVPRLLQKGELEIVADDGDTARVVGYMRTDPLHMDSKLLANLDAFDGERSLKKATKRLAKAGVELTLDMALVLYDYEILVEPAE